MPISRISHPSRPKLWPLEGSVGESFVAGKTFAQQQEFAWSSPETLHIYDTVWICSTDIKKLTESSDIALVTPDGTILAWKGSADSNQVIAAEGSFFIQHSWDLLKLNEQILSSLTESQHSGDVHPAANVDGVLITGEGTRILPGVYVEGTVVIGKNCKIGPNCYLRGSTTIGDGCHVGQSVEIKNSILGHKTSVGHLSYVGDSILAGSVNFGAGTTTSNLRHDGENHKTMVEGELIDTGRRKFGTVVGPGVHTGIHTAIYPGRKLAPHSSTLPNECVTQDTL